MILSLRNRPSRQEEAMNAYELGIVRYSLEWIVGIGIIQTALLVGILVAILYTRREP